MRFTSLLSRYRDPLVALFALALPFLFFVSNNRSPRDHNVVDRVVVTISAPVQWLTVKGLDGVTRLWRHYIYLVNLQETNEQLVVENAALRNEVQQREEDRLENERLRKMIGLRDREPRVGAVFAHVIATAPTPLFRSLRVDRGTTDGVHLGAAVIGYDGVVGRVAAVSFGYADVMLLVDANNSMDVLVQRTRVRARIRGMGGDDVFGVDVQYLSRTEDVEPGDVLISSGTGNVFPKGLRVGTVVSVARGRFGLYQQATVEPSVDFGRIEEVMILERGWPEGSSYEPDDPEQTFPAEQTSERIPRVGSGGQAGTSSGSGH